MDKNTFCYRKFQQKYFFNILARQPENIMLSIEFLVAKTADRSIATKLHGSRCSQRNGFSEFILYFN